MRFITFLKLCPIGNSSRILNTTDNQIFTYTSRAKLFLSHGFYEKSRPYKPRTDENQP